jgi:putative NIF3 family GTP cyclohydrolase 1 type 2
MAFNAPVIRHSPLLHKPVARIAVCGGAGSFLIPNALQAGADFFISADIKYHDFFEGGSQMVIADIGHFESEQFTVDLLHAVILEKYPNFAVLKSGIITNPVNYYI